MLDWYDICWQQIVAFQWQLSSFQARMSNLNNMTGSLLDRMDDSMDKITMNDDQHHDNSLSSWSECPFLLGQWPHLLLVVISHWTIFLIGKYFSLVNISHWKIFLDWKIFLTQKYFSIGKYFTLDNISHRKIFLTGKYFSNGQSPMCRFFLSPPSRS